MRKVWDAIASIKALWKAGGSPKYVALYLSTTDRLKSWHVDWVDSRPNGTQVGEEQTQSGVKGSETLSLIKPVWLFPVDGEQPRVDPPRTRSHLNMLEFYLLLVTRLRTV